MRNESTSPQTPKRSFRWGRLFLIIAVVMGVIFAGVGLGFVTASYNTMPNLQNDIRPAASSQIFDSHGTLITTVHSVENRVPVPLSKVPQNLQNAFVAVEDARFYQHMGVDPRGILRAAWSNVTGGGVAEGGSTITQQLAKNALLSQERTMKRKIQEAFLALQIERQYTKHEILEMYVNHIYFGQGAYGVQTAARVYFNKNAEDLTLAECAMLAGIPKSPNYYSPLNNLKAAKERQRTVLEQMVKYGYIDASTAQSAAEAPLKLASGKTNNDKSDKTAAYFIDYVVQSLIDKYGADAVYKEGLKVYTSLDLTMQQAAETALTHLPSYRKDANGIMQPQGALVAIDPRSGYIKAMVGGRGDDQFNRAVMAERQPGSVFKTFTYLAAIESGMTPATSISDTAVSFGSWSPRNYDGRFYGNISLRYALEQSRNVPTVKLANQLGADKPLYYAQQMGISTLVLQGPTNDRNLAMSLGGLTKGVTPLEMASAYGVLANQGIRCEPIAIVKVVDRNGKTLEEHSPQPKTIISEKSAYIVTDMLKGVIARGTGAGAAIGRPAAGKTGTTDNNKDAWFVGYTPDLVAAVWMGNDTEGTLGDITGGTVPAEIWRLFMTKALASTPARDFLRPQGVSVPQDTSTPVPPDDKAAADKKQEDDKKKAATKQPEKATTKPNDTKAEDKKTDSKKE